MCECVSENIFLTKTEFCVGIGMAQIFPDKIDVRRIHTGYPRSKLCVCTKHLLRIGEEKDKTLAHGNKVGLQQTNQKLHQDKEIGTTVEYSP